MISLNLFIRWFSLAIVFGVVAGCATTGNPRDPLEPMNRGIYGFNQGIDKAVIKPVAQGYRTVVPSPVRTGVKNFFSNLNDVIVVANDLLQFKIGQAFSDTGRILVNSTIGILGILDVATHMGLEKHNEDFGQTLGYWGLDSGPYLVLPFLGPSSFRDTFGLAVDAQIDPVLNYDDVSERNGALALRIIDSRSRTLDAGNLLDEAALDPYEFLRDAYLQRRESLVRDGNGGRRYDDAEDFGPASGAKPSAPAEPASKDESKAPATNQPPVSESGIKAQ